MEELNVFIESNSDPRELKRALAVRMTLQGYLHREIMPVLQVCSGWISKWKQEFIFNGVEGLKLAYQGSQGYLTPHAKQKILIWLKSRNHWNLNLFHQAGISWKKSQKKIRPKILKRAN